MFCNIIEITLCYGCSPVNLLHIFRTSFPKITSRWLLLDFNKFFFLQYYYGGLLLRTFNFKFFQMKILDIVFLDPRPSVPISSAVGPPFVGLRPQNIARLLFNFEVVITLKL